MKGFDKHPINHNLLLGVTLDEMTTGAAPSTHDKAKPHHTLTLTGGSWGNLASGLPRLTLNGTSEFVECAAAASADLNFTSQAYSIAMWVNADAGGATAILIQQGLTDTDGWVFFMFNLNLSLRHNQAGAHTDISAVAARTDNVWQLLGVTRSGASGQFHVNGEPVTTTLGAGLTNPVTAGGARKLLIGVDNTEAANFLDGIIAGGPCGPRIWNRALTAAEWKSMFRAERHWLGV